jgi:hypothetical protein
VIAVERGFSHKVAMMLRWSLVVLMCTPILPAPALGADTSGEKLSTALRHRDVTLDGRSILKGRTSPDTIVIFRNASYEKHIKSGPDGAFAAQIQPGVYVVQVGDSGVVCRVWANNTSPPCATTELAVPTVVVRGQSASNVLMRMDQLAWPALIVTGVGLVTWAAIDGNSAS